MFSFCYTSPIYKTQYVAYVDMRICQDATESDQWAAGIYNILQKIWQIQTKNNNHKL